MCHFATLVMKRNNKKIMQLRLKRGSLQLPNFWPLMIQAALLRHKISRASARLLTWQPHPAAMSERLGGVAAKRRKIKWRTGTGVAPSAAQISANSILPTQRQSWRASQSKPASRLATSDANSKHRKTTHRRAHKAPKSENLHSLFFRNRNGIRTAKHSSQVNPTTRNRSEVLPWLTGVHHQISRLGAAPQLQKYGLLSLPLQLRMEWARSLPSKGVRLCLVRLEKTLL